MTKKEWVKAQIQQFPEADPAVLGFIYNITSMNVTQDTPYQNTPEYYFSNGLCYHFAVMLQNMFGGELMWHKFHAHIVWVDNDGGSYDAHGVFSDWENCLLPISVLSKTDLQEFQHVKSHTKLETLKGNLETAQNTLRYEIEHQFHEELLEETRNMIATLESMIRREKNYQKE